MRPLTSNDYKPGKMGHLHEDVSQCGYVHELAGCQGVCHFTGKIFTNSPEGSEMVYAIYECDKCKGRSGLCSELKKENIT